MNDETTTRLDQQTFKGFDLVSMADVDCGRFWSQTFSAESLELHPVARSASQTTKANQAPRLGIVPVSGILTKYGSEYGSSSDAVGDMVEEAANSGQFDGLMLRADSPGGLTAGVYESNAKIAAAAKKIPIHAHVDGVGASACVALICPAARTTLSKGSLMGSMGTYSSVDDSTEFFKQLGITRHVVKAGEHKADGLPGTPVTEKQLAERQKIVDAMNEHFVSAFAEGKNLPIATARAMADGRIHVGQAAVTAGFADAVATFDEAMAALADAVSQKTSQKGKNKMSEQTTAPVAATLAELKQNFPKADAAFILSQIEAGATLTTARQAFDIAQRDAEIAAKSKELAARDAELAKIKADLDAANAAKIEAEKKASASAATPAKKPGVPALGTEGISHNSSGDAVSEWEAAIKSEMDSGRNKVDATRNVIRSNPQLHESYLQAINQGRRSRPFQPA